MNELLTNEELDTMTPAEVTAHYDKQRGDERIADLRAFANYLEEHPVVAAKVNMPRFYAFTYTEETWKELLKGIGSFDKGSDSYSLTAQRAFGSIIFQASISHSEVCERKVVGTRTVVKDVYPEDVKPDQVMSEEDIVEWVCPDSWKA